MTSNNPPMDWYPDPADPARERYWDGQAWTHNTRPVPAVPTPPPPANPWAAAPSPADAPDMPQQYGQQQYGQSTGGYGPYQGWNPAMGSQGMATQSMDSREVTADGVRLAGWWSRVWAWILDNILITLLGTLVGWNFAQKLATDTGAMMDEVIAAAESNPSTAPDVQVLMDKYGLLDTANNLSMIIMAVTFVYLLLMWRFRGATLGQLLLGIRVVPTDQGTAARPLAWSVAIIRSLTFVVASMVPLVSLVSYLMPLWTRRRQTLHDMVARTQVVRTR